MPCCAAKRTHLHSYGMSMLLLHQKQHRPMGRQSSWKQRHPQNHTKQQLTKELQTSHVLEQKLLKHSTTALERSHTPSDLRSLAPSEITGFAARTSCPGAAETRTEAEEEAAVVIEEEVAVVTAAEDVVVAMAADAEEEEGVAEDMASRVARRLSWRGSRSHSLTGG